MVACKIGYPAVIATLVSAARHPRLRCTRNGGITRVSDMGTGMKLTTLAMAALALATAGCATMASPPPPPPPNPMGTFEALSTARELASPGTYLGPTPTAVVVLKSGQTARNTAFCQGYGGLPTVAEGAAGSVTAVNAIPLRWMLKTEPETAPADCAALLAGYDFPRAEALIASLTALPEGAQMTGIGPFVVEFMPDGSALVIDGSSRSATQVRQMAPMWLAWSGQTVPAPDGPASGCLLQSAGASGAMADRAKAWLQCEFPDGLDVKTMKAIGCAAGRLIGGYVTVAVTFFCEP